MERWFDIGSRVGVSLLAVYTFYSAAGTKWPSSYYLLDDAIGAKAARTTWAYAGFRFAPIFVASLCAMAYQSSHVDRFATATCIALGHLAISLARINPSINPGPSRARSWYALQLVVLLISVAVIAAAAALAPALDGVLPQWRDIVGALVTAVFVVSLSVLLQRSFSKDSIHNDSAIDRAYSQYKLTVPQIALEQGVDRNFASALVVVEELQRPSWFRAVEKRLARFGLANTVGPAQSSSVGYRTDEQGIRELLGTVGDLAVRNVLSRGRMAAAAERCNEGDGYVEFVLHAYNRISRFSTESSYIDVDGNALISAYRPTLMHGEWEVSGDIGPSATGLYALNNDTHEEIAVTAEPTTSSNPTRRRWTVAVPVEWEYFVLTTSVVDEEDHTRQVHVSTYL